MIKIITKFYALSLVLFFPLFASSGITERSDPTNFEINCDGQPKMLERFGPANFDFEINCNNKPIRQIKYRSDIMLEYLELYTDNNHILGYMGDPTSTAENITITLVKGEKLIGICGKLTDGFFLDSLTFLTNKRTIEGYSRSTGMRFMSFALGLNSEEFNYKSNQEVFSIFGRKKDSWPQESAIIDVGISFISPGTFIIPEKTLKDRYGKETRFIADLKLNQGNLGTCTGYAAVSSLMYQAGSSELNPKSIYMGNENVEGLFIEKAMSRIKKKGVTLHTFHEKNVQNTFWMFENYFPLPIKQGDLKNVSIIEKALDEHKIPIVGTVNGRSFSDYKEEFKGFLNEKPKEDLVANHAVLIIGYDKIQKKIIIKNSWNDGNSMYPYNEFIKGLNCAYIGKGAKAFYK